MFYFGAHACNLVVFRSARIVASARYVENRGFTARGQKSNSKKPAHLGWHLIVSSRVRWKGDMKLKSYLTLCVMSFMFASCSAQDWGALWRSYVAGFMDKQIRVIDHDAGDRTTSEGQAYGM